MNIACAPELLWGDHDCVTWDLGRLCPHSTGERAEAQIGEGTVKTKLDPSPQTIYKWIKDNISPKLHVEKGFVNILMTSFLQYISSEVNPPSDETDSCSAPSEKQLLLSFKPVMQKFLHDHVDLQVSALYALQVHCYNSNFPKGMLLLFFVHFYDMEIIEEEAFLAWKENITQEFPGKGKALFQVNQWLTWLETAEEEESEEEAD